MSSAFLLIQARELGDPMAAHEVSCFARSMGVGLDALRVVNALERLPSRAELRESVGVVIGGSGDFSCLDELDWIRSLVDFTRVQLLGGHSPVFASCFGFQILVLALGGEMIRDPENMETGSIPLRLKDAGLADPLFAPLGRTFVGQVAHKDRAASLPPGVHSYASSERCPIHALRVGEAPIWATQFHPELRPEDMRLRYLHYRDLYSPPGTSPLPEEEDPFLLGLRPSGPAEELLRRFARGVLLGRLGPSSR